MLKRKNYLFTYMSRLYLIKSVTRMNNNNDKIYEIQEICLFSTVHRIIYKYMLDVHCTT